jgi:hypothetical protein
LKIKKLLLKKKKMDVKSVERQNIIMEMKKVKVKIVGRNQVYQK